MLGNLAFCLIIVLSTNLLFTDNAARSPFGIFLLQEAYYGFLIVYALGRLLGRFSGSDIILLAFVALAFGLSVGFSYLQFGQPIFYGMLEDRRMMALLSYFPLADLFARQKFDVARFRLCWYSAMAVVVCLLFIGRGLVQEAEVRELVRSGRITAGGLHLGLTAIIATVLMTRRPTYLDLFGLAASLLTIHFVTQTRSVLIAAVVTCTLVIVTQRRSLAAIVNYAIIWLPLAVCVGIWQWANIYDIFDLYTNTNRIGGSFEVRGMTVDLIQDFWATRGGSLIGFGALSQQFNGGFAAIFGGMFGEYFFLSDIGILGEYFRYGLVYIPLLLFFGVFIWLALRQSSGVPRRFVIFCLIFLLIPSPLFGTFTWIGSIYAMILSFSRLSEGAEYAARETRLRA